MQGVIFSQFFAADGVRNRSRRYPAAGVADGRAALAGADGRSAAAAGCGRGGVAWLGVLPPTLIAGPAGAEDLEVLQRLLGSQLDERLLDEGAPVLVDPQPDAALQRLALHLFSREVTNRALRCDGLADSG